LKQQKVNKFKNQIHLISLPSKNIEEQIKNINVKFLPTKSKKIEDKVKIPSFVKVFLYYINKKQKLPTQEEFAKVFLQATKNKKYYTLQNSKEREALKARIFRVYPSLIRELHFIRKIYEDNFFDEVIYNFELDLRKGFDLVVKTGNIYYGLKIFVSTKRSYMYLDKKKYRQDNNVELFKLNVPFNFKEKQKYNRSDILLYEDKDVKNLYGKIIKHLSQEIM